MRANARKDRTDQNSHDSPQCPSRSESSWAGTSNSGPKFHQKKEHSKFHHVPSLKLTYPLKICRNPKGPFIFQASIFRSKTGIFKSKRYFQNQYPSHIQFIFFAYYPSEEHFSGPNAKTVFPRLKPDMQKPPLSLCQNLC